MDVTAVCQRVRGVASARAAAVAGTATRAGLETALRSITVVRSWLAAAEADLAAGLAGLASFPEQAVAEAARSSLGEAGRVLERASTLGSTPALAGALNSGSVTSGHVDVVSRVAKGLDSAADRAELSRRADGLAGVAAAGSVAEFRRRLEREASTIRADGGMARFERQKAAVRLRRWTDDDGMWCLFARFDPLTGVRLSAGLDAEVEARFAQSVPEGCPTDPMAKQQFLAAMALAGLVTGEGVAARAGRPEFVVVIETDARPRRSRRMPSTGGRKSGAADGHDARTDSPHAGVEVGDLDGRCSDSGGPRPGGSSDGGGADDGGGSSDGGGATDCSGAADEARGGPVVDWGLPVEVPYRVLADLLGEAEVHAVVVRNGVVLHAPGELNLGRTTRLAGTAQRRALRALYATCAIPGCSVRFDRCKIHHVRWWRHGGRTDLENLLPVCVHHHAKVHDAGWVVVLGPDRALEVRYPDGMVHNTGPPSRRAA